MSNYYVVTIQKTETENPVSIFGYETREEAQSAFHSTLASCYQNENLVEFSVVVLNEHGGTEDREFWVKPSPLPEVTE